MAADDNIHTTRSFLPSSFLPGSSSTFRLFPTFYFVFVGRPLPRCPVVFPGNSVRGAGKFLDGGSAGEFVQRVYMPARRNVCPRFLPCGVNPRRGLCMSSRGIKRGPAADETQSAITDERTDRRHDRNALLCRPPIQSDGGIKNHRLAVF